MGVKIEETYIYRLTDPPRPLGKGAGQPTDRPSLGPLAPTDPTRVTRPTDSPAPGSPLSGWVGPPDRPTLSAAATGRLVYFQLRAAFERFFLLRLTHGKPPATLGSGHTLTYALSIGRSVPLQ